MANRPVNWRGDPESEEPDYSAETEPYNEYPDLRPWYERFQQFGYAFLFFFSIVVIPFAIWLCYF